MKDLEEISPVPLAGSIIPLTVLLRRRPDTSLEFKQTGWPVTAADIAVNHSSRLQTNLGNEDFAYVSEETYKLQLAGQLSQPVIIDPLDGTRDFIDRTGNMRFTPVNEGRPVLAVVAWPARRKVVLCRPRQRHFCRNRDGKVTPLKVSQSNRGFDPSR